MRKLKVISILIFAVSLAVFGVYKIHSRVTADEAGPEITMDAESITVSAEASEEELLQGVKATDKSDGDVSDTLLVETESNFIEKGRRNITIAAFDSDNHITKASREVIYNDYHAPQFALSEPLKFPTGVQNILSSMSVEDMLDGSLTENIKISGEYTLDADIPGEYPMMFTVSNSAGDVSELMATVEIYDPAEEGRKPQISLSEYIVYTSAGKKIDPWAYVTSVTIGGHTYEKEDDGILRDQSPSQGQERTEISPEDVNIVQDIDYETPGTYEIIYQISGSDGNTGEVRLITVVR